VFRNEVLVDGLWGFLTLAVILSVTPGPDDVLVLRSSLRGGPRLGMATAAGIVVGTLAWGIAAGLGLVGLVAGAGPMYDRVRLAGGAYLVLLGAAPLAARVLQRGRAVVPATGRHARPPDPGALPAFATGLMSDLLNPKIGMFYVAVLPQFVPVGEPVLRYSLLLCAIDVGVALIWLLGLTWAAAAASAWFRRPPVVRWSQRLLSGTLIVLGAAAALGS
jgi:threonine/homoserine/homoserine lactone efflux protein